MDLLPDWTSYPRTLKNILTLCSLAREMEPQIPVLPAHPGTQAREWEKKYTARPLSEKDWSMHRETFTRLYITEDRSLSHVRQIMAKDYGFFAKYTCTLITSKNTDRLTGI